MAACAVWPATALGVTPESPEVKACIARGMQFLASGTDTRLGGSCLLGLAFIKSGAPAEHPQVAAAVKACEASKADDDLYSLGLALIFLCELDPTKHQATAQKFIDELLKLQKPHGGWGYREEQTGDTSQTQYAALGLWNAIRQGGFNIPMDRVERLCGWLLRTQDPSGAWGYQGVDPGNGNRVPQSDIRPSLVAAGLGSLYICADLLGITDVKKQVAESGVPAALRPIDSAAPADTAKRFVTRAIDHTAVRRAMADGNQWFVRNPAIEVNPWNYYYLYGLERYYSFRELGEKRVEAEPKWYNDCFAFLQRKQAPEGQWQSEDTDHVNTAFAVLCLMRSSKKSIQKVVPNLGDGVLLGGMGLPPATADLVERDGKLVATPLAGSVDELLAALEDPANEEATRLAESKTAVALDGDVTKRAGQIVRLRSLVSAGSYESRLVAVRTLAKVRDLDNVPILLYALTDPDLRIVREADRGLRFISRKFAGVGPLDEPTNADVQKLIKAWKEWYLNIRPDAELLD
ncbi:MAG: prenyltransferase/squalene oxidase repeat-containing protein [Pirellulaceae bacterium]|nr:prenyltransferase/squalene oxidase repeat-containing protein [Pirellulaceae bacterium]